MNTRATVAVAVLAFVAGVASGIAGSRSPLFARSASGPTAVQQGRPSKASRIRDLLSEVTDDSVHFVLAGSAVQRGGCDQVVSATIHDEYMEIAEQRGLKYFIPYGAIYRIDREGPGNVQMPVVYTTAAPVARFCGD